MLACDKATPIAPTGAVITLSVNPTVIAADGEAEVTAIVRRDGGAPVNPGTQVIFTTTLGELVPGTASTDDAGVARTKLLGKGQVGLATVGASSGAASQVEVEVQIGSLASSISLQATPSSLPAEGGTVRLVAVVRDGNGALLKDFPVNFSSEIGVLGSGGGTVLTNDRGEARDELRVGEREIAALGQSFFEVTASAAAEDGSLIEGVAEVRVAGAVAFITLQASPATVPEGGGTLELLALVRDQAGDPVGGAGVNFITEVGTLASGGSLVSSDDAGEARDRLTVTSDDLSGVSRSFEVKAQTVKGDGTLDTATFLVGVELVQRFELRVTIAPAGSGRVTSDSGGIDCPTSCSAQFDEDDNVKLTASPSVGFTFKEWSGCSLLSDPELNLKMTQNFNCQANFE